MNLLKNNLIYLVAIGIETLFMYGLILPYLISAKSTLTVLFGLILAVAYSLWVINKIYNIFILEK